MGKKGKARRGPTPRRLRPSGGPPPEVTAAYLEIFQWAEANPKEAAEIMSFDEALIANLVMGIGYAEQMNHSPAECANTAANIRIWCVLTGVLYLYDWPLPVATMSDEQIIAAIAMDRATGALPPLVKG